MSQNADLQKRRVDAVARGVGNATQLFAVRAENAEVWDADGRRYIDFAGGIGVMNTGHRHPKVMARIQKQLEAFTHTCFQVMPYEPYIELAEALNKRAPIDGKAKTLFVTTGAEAVENAIKIARAYTKRPGVIAFGGGYHGRTLLTLGLTGKIAPYKIGFGPFPADIFHARFPHAYHGISVADALHDIADLFKYDIEPSRVAAFIIEPVLGEGGFTPTPPEFMRALRALCDEHGILLIADEVQSGFARTGKLFAMEHFDVKADLITTVINNVNAIVATITTAVGEQSKATEEIASNINQAASGLGEVNENVSQISVVASTITTEIALVNSASGDVSASSTLVDTSSGDLQILAQELQKAVGSFKI